uniref:Uncharacterized protein n=1 Tax=Cucumis melo TaxID=3656 RepID=A0A9I9EML4_CUCME
MGLRLIKHFFPRYLLPICTFPCGMSYNHIQIDFLVRILSAGTSFLLVRALCMLLSRNISLRSLFVQYSCRKVFIALVVRGQCLRKCASKN